MTANALRLPTPLASTEPPAREGVLFACQIWLAVRVLLSSWGALRFWMMPAAVYQNVQAHMPDVTAPPHDLTGYLLGMWNIYDTRHYITIAQHGYTADPNFLPVFFPGYPLLIKGASIFLLGQPLAAALLVSNVATWVFFYYFYRLIVSDYGKAVARRAVILSAVFPSAFFLLLGYSEAPLLAFTVSALYYARKRHWLVAGLLAGAAALIKQPGVLIMLPLAYLWWRAYQRPADALARPPHLSALWLLCAPLAAAGYMVYRYLYLQVPSQGLTDLGGAESLTIPVLPLLNAIRALRPDNPVLIANIWDLCFVILLLGLVGGVVGKVRSAPYTFYSLALTFVTLAVTWSDASRPEVNMPRRLLIIFPVYLYLALISSRPRVFQGLVALCLVFWLVFSSLFINWVFVS